MTKRQEIEQQIASLEFSKSLLEEKIKTLTATLEEMKAKEKEKWEANEYSKDSYTKPFAEYFRGLGYYIVGCQDTLPSDKYYNFAKQIWGCRQDALPFLKELYKNLKKKFPYPIESLPPERKTDFLNLCKTMVDNKWITIDQTKTPWEVVPSFPKEYSNFLNGGWAEYVNRYLINKVLPNYSREHHLKYKVIWDVKLKQIESDKNNINDMQLDIVVKLNKIFYVFETKTGALGIEKWVKRAELLNQNGNRFLTCCMDSEVNPKLFQPYWLLCLEGLEEQLLKLLKSDFPTK